jgi:hypothetical protein
MAETLYEDLVSLEEFKSKFSNLHPLLKDSVSHRKRDLIDKYSKNPLFSSVKEGKRKIKDFLIDLIENDYGIFNYIPTEKNKGFQQNLRYMNELIHYPDKHQAEYLDKKIPELY